MGGLGSKLLVTLLNGEEGHRIAEKVCLLIEKGRFWVDGQTGVREALVGEVFWVAMDSIVADSH